MSHPALIQEPMAILALLLAVLALLFAGQRQSHIARLYKAIPLLVFAYFVPTLLSNLGVIPLASPLYTFISSWLLPASLLLLVLSVDIGAIVQLGRQVAAQFLSATAGIVGGGPLAYWLFGRRVRRRLGDQAWRGLAAIGGSWIGGGANFIAIGKSVGASESTLSLMVVADVVVANSWMAVLLYFAGRERSMDASIGADRRGIDLVRDKIGRFESEVARAPALADLLAITALAFGCAAVAHAVAAHLPPLGQVVSRFTWVVLIVTTLGLGLSLTPLRRLEGAGASKLGSLLLYLLVTSIGARAEFRRVVEAPALVVVCGAWMTIHAAVVMIVRRLLRAPIFFAAVGSQANVGGAASAPIVAAAFHPSLAPVGVLLAVAGYVLGTYAGLLCATLLEIVDRFVS